MARVGAVSDVSVLLAALALLLATVAVWWVIGHRAAQGRQARTRRPRKHPGGRARGPRRSPGAPVAARASRPAATPRKHPNAPATSSKGPCSCGPCLSVAKELQGLMLLLRAHRGTWAPLHPAMWRVLWAHLQQLGKRGHLPCCASSRCSGRFRPFGRLLQPRGAIPGTASSPSRRLPWPPTVPLRSSGRPRSSLPGASTASDSLQPCKSLLALQRLPPSQNLPGAETPPPSQQLATASIPAESPQPFKILRLPRPVLRSQFLPPSHTFPPGGLQPSRPLTKASEPAHPEEALDSSSCSLQDQQHPMPIESPGVSQATETARESREAETGAQLETEKHSQEQVAEPQISCSHQGPAQGSQDAVPDSGRKSPSSVAQTVPRRPWQLRGLQEAAPRRPPQARQVVTGVGGAFHHRC
ncbi:hypothetical protein DUI87_30553 [Hirundo rustica rustica]|uniref:Uncharacterized protein n=1 Tax=Hirundo rustica rustica TaxID=333673 RepID=A0A3M0IW62_HIRRU|nr:hypothetical protein DUI87_30546 [Hirundo rustica rustica]RMB93041.1 hypothetical protein DUI87_30547 [Hirundo rustica rustica]RMB93042.1 hypothetical protein DUI87_30548 [Hirundo rustica rustica]RMB93043.1 hypothetical protein DUI87_30549 [Hirundo rustica rustica]RMB93044.1 hypothetical protein DUI87_30550 [Hirundo rustica rustica]